VRQPLAGGALSDAMDRSQLSDAPAIAEMLPDQAFPTDRFRAEQSGGTTCLADWALASRSKEAPNRVVKMFLLPHTSVPKCGREARFAKTSNDLGESLLKRCGGLEAGKGHDY
jgi:hypothetical protein